MKKIIFFLLLTSLITIPIYSQVSFSGSADIAIGANIPESEDYSSLLNPANVFGMKDISVNTF